MSGQDRTTDALAKAVVAGFNSADPRGQSAVTSEVLVAHADPDEYARIWNEGYEAAMTQHLADDPSAADDWLAAHTAAAEARGAQAVLDAVEAVDVSRCRCDCGEKALAAAREAARNAGARECSCPPADPEDGAR